jgi:hypothetical protein
LACVQYLFPIFSLFHIIRYMWRSCKRSSRLVMSNYLPTTKSKVAQRSRLKVKFYICVSFVAFLMMQDLYTNPSKSNFFWLFSSNPFFFLRTIWSDLNLFVRIKPPNPNLQVHKSGFLRILLAYWNKDSLGFVGICWICVIKSDLLNEAIKLTMLTFLKFLKIFL